MTEGTAQGTREAAGTPARRTRPARWAAGGFVAGLLVAVVVTLTAVLLDHALHHRRVLGNVVQPAAVSYPDGARHHAAVVDYRGLLSRRHQSYELFVGSDPSLNYGHWVTLEFTGEDRPVIEEARWEQAGVRVRFESGHELFVPARFFMYGR